MIRQSQTVHTAGLPSGQSLAAAIDAAVLGALAEHRRGLILVPLPAEPGPRHTVRLTTPDHVDAWAEALGSDRVLRLRYQPESLVEIALGARQGGIPVVLDLTSVHRPHGVLSFLAKGGATKEGAPCLVRVARRTGDLASDALALAAAATGTVSVALPAFPSDGIALTAHAFETGQPTVMFEHGAGRRATAGRLPALPAPLDGIRRLKEGADLTIVALGALAHAADEAAGEALRRDGIASTVLTPVRLETDDFSPVMDSVSQTGRMLILDTVDGPLGAAFAARVARTAPHHLLAPISVQCVDENGPDPAGRIVPLIRAAAWRMPD